MPVKMLMKNVESALNVYPSIPVCGILRHIINYTKQYNI